MKSDTLVTASWDEALETALAALNEGYVTLDQLQEAAATRRNLRPVIGRLGLKQGMLSMAQVFRILEQQAFTGELFGEIAVKFGFLNEFELYKLLQLQSNLTPSLAEVLKREGFISDQQRSQIDEQVRQRMQARPQLTDARLTH